MLAAPSAAVTTQPCPPKSHGKPERPGQWGFASLVTGFATPADRGCVSLSHTGLRHPRVSRLRHVHSPPRHSPWPGRRFLGPCLRTTASPPTGRAGAGASRCGSPRRILSAARCRSAPRTLRCAFRSDFTHAEGDKCQATLPRPCGQPTVRAFHWWTASPVCHLGSHPLTWLLLLQASQ